MAGRSAEQLLREFSSNAEADVTMSLLRSGDALVHLALMAAHLGDGQVVDGGTLAAAVERDLPRMQPMTGDAGPAPDPDALLTRWTKKGWVHRTVDPDTGSERYQLTAGAAQAVRQMRTLRRHTSTATESALAMVMAGVHQIATEANPDLDARRAALDDQIRVLTEQRAALDRGEAPVVAHAELAERVSALMHLVERIPADIARYGERMQANTVALIRQSLSEDATEFAESLRRMFEGHDVIAESPEGQAFRAFATLIGTPSQRAQLESDITDVLARVDGLPGEVAEALAGFIDAMWQRVKEVEQARGMAFRRINNFVRGGDIAHYRSMRTRVAEAQAAAAEAFAVTHGGRDVGFAVPTAGVEATSVGRLRLHEGLAEPPDPLADDGGFAIDPAALVGAESIDWAALRRAVNTARDRHDGYATLAEVLELVEEPRTGDVIGLWSLANRHGASDLSARTTAVVHTGRGPRAITLPYLLFGEPIPDPAVDPGRRRGLLEGVVADA
ncbi:DUF3375 family protein [Actinocatenispora rupis]|uniref:DUF3375 domain-containing protein n=1 Tax=Actinocatenispora rupis TaxID=519421 RepID=A0A8J3NAV8_9ACTN|nr:DUF3375 family protein [Actinocatenispora rupis]GID09967.1 hypothetical protein Aru02nite_08560 [Actinocatenispora rupis]